MAENHPSYRTCAIEMKVSNATVGSRLPVIEAQNYVIGLQIDDV